MLALTTVFPSHPRLTVVVWDEPSPVSLDPRVRWLSLWKAALWSDWGAHVCRAYCPTFRPHLLDFASMGHWRVIANGFHHLKSLSLVFLLPPKGDFWDPPIPPKLLSSLLGPTLGAEDRMGEGRVFLSWPPPSS